VSTPSPLTELEEWFEVAATGARALDRGEYQALVADWQSQFEQLLKAQDRRAGAKAEAGVRALLPRDVFVFSIPGYRYLPAATNAQRDPRFGFYVTQLRTIDFNIANRMDAILAGSELTFACLCTHEAGAFAEPILVPASAGRIVQQL
jgi:hypothetical protein